jgi:Ca2+-binding RTX toxin-like protein
MVQILTQFNDTLILGDDTVPAQDTVFGLDGSDTLITDETVGGSVLYGNRDSDSLVSRSSGNIIYGGQENDRLQSLNSGGSLFFGDLGDDLFESFGGTGKDTVYGGTSDGSQSDGDDIFNFGNGLGGNLGYGNTGDDFLSGSGFGSDTLYGGKGDDTIQVVEVSGSSGTGGGSTGFVPESIEGASFTVSSALNTTTTTGGGSTTDGVGVVTTTNVNAPLNPGKNYLSGDLGDDLVIGLGDRDSLFGGEGTDTLVMLGNISPDGQDTSNENTSLAGNAEGLNGVPQNASLVGGAGDDSVVAFGGTRGRNTLLGGEGNDTIRNFGDESEVRGGEGNDTILQEGINEVRFGESSLWGGAGNDSINASGSSGTNLIYGEEGSDTLVGTNAVTNDANASGDTIFGGDAAGDDTSNDSLVGGANSLMFGNQGNDTLVAGDGTNAATNSSLYGGQGGDSLFIATESSNIYLWGDLGSDTLNVNGTSNNSLQGGEGNDSLYGVGGDFNSLSGGAGNDILVAGTANDSLIGGEGDDFFVGTTGADTLGGAEDRLGSDTLFGDAGADSLVGTSGLFDGFYYANSLDIGTGAAAGSDTITSFETGTDKIYLRSTAFGNVDAGGATVANLAAPGQNLRSNLDFFSTANNQNYTTLNGSFSGGSDSLPAIVFDSNGTGGGTLYWDINGGGTAGTDPGQLSVIATIETGRVNVNDIVIF